MSGVFAVLAFVAFSMASSISFAKLVTKASVAKAEPEFFTKTVSIFSKLKSEAPLIFKVNKIQKSELLDSAESQEGLLTYFNGRFKWEVTQPEKAMVIYDGQTLWSVQYPPEGFDGPRQILKTKPKNSMKDQMIINQLLSAAKMKSDYKHVKSVVGTDSIVVILEPTKTSQSISQLELTLNKEATAIMAIAYLDDLKNRTTFEIIEIKKKQKLNKDTFKFTPDPNDQVSNL